MREATACVRSMRGREGWEWVPYPIGSLIVSKRERGAPLVRREKAGRVVCRCEYACAEVRKVLPPQQNTTLALFLNGGVTRPHACVHHSGALEHGRDVREAVPGRLPGGRPARLIRATCQDKDVI